MGEPVKHYSDYWLVPFIFLISFVVFYCTAIPLLDDNDVPWHLAAGALLLDTHRIPATDPWSFATQGNPWYLLSWMWDLLLGVIERSLGIFAVLMFILALCAAVVAGLSYRLLAMRIALPAVFFTVMLAALCILDYVTARPQLAGYALVLVFHTLLHRSRTNDRYGALCWLPPLMLLWANTHGSFIAGFTLVGAYIIEAAVSKNYRWLGRLAVIAIACVAATLITPYGTRIALGALQSLGATASKYTTEWLPFSFSASTGVSAWLMVFILATNIRSRGVMLADKLLAVAWLLVTMFAMRNGAIFILVSAPYLATCFDEQTRDLRTPRKPSAFMDFMRQRNLRTVWVATIALFACAVAAFWVLPHQDKIQSETSSVTDAVDYAMEHYPTHRFLTDYNFGGLVIYQTRGTLPFYMDSRAGTAYSDQAMSDYIEFMWLRPGWPEHLKTYGINGMIISKNMGFAQAFEEGRFHEEWQLAFSGKRANVYIARH